MKLKLFIVFLTLLLTLLALKGFSQVPVTIEQIETKQTLTVSRDGQSNTVILFTDTEKYQDSVKYELQKEVNGSFRKVAIYRFNGDNDGKYTLKLIDFDEPTKYRMIITYKGTQSIVIQSK